ncbi:MAG: hypothetical protein ACPGQL_10795 [Thermoplasmatota archaeon]
MTTPFLRTLAALAVLALAVPTASGMTGALEAERVTFEGDVVGVGDAVAFALHMGTSGSSSASSLAGSLRADHVTIETVTEPIIAAGTAGVASDLVGEQGTRVQMGGAFGETINRYELNQVDLRVAEHQDRIGVHGFGEEGETTPSRARLQEAALQAVDGFYIGQDGLALQAPGGSGEPILPENSIIKPANGTDFKIREVAGDWVLSNTDEGAASFRLEGNFEIEMIGVTLRGLAAEGEQEVRSGYFRAPLAPATSSERVVGYDNFTMARLMVVGGVLELTAILPGPGVQMTSGSFQWALAGVNAASKGTVALSGATGELEDGGAQRTLRGQSEVFQGSYEWLTRPLEDAERPGLGMTVAPASARDLAEWTPATITPSPGSSTWNVIPVAAGVAVFLAAALAFVAMRLRRVDYDDVEAALEGQRFPEAARLARRLLRRDGGHEEAAISLGVALTKAGRPHEAVAAVQQHVVVHEPSDGVLHYVLGLAFLESGQEDAARAALGEALERTPALEAEMRHNPATKPFFSPRGAPSVKGTTAYV